MLFSQPNHSGRYSVTRGRCSITLKHALGLVFNVVVYVTFIENFDGWARAGCDGWSFDDVLPFFKKLEDFKGDGAMLFAVVIGFLLLQMLSLILILVELLLLILLQK